VIAHLLGWTTLTIGLVIMVFIAIRQPRVAGPLITAYLVRATLTLVHVYAFRVPGSNGDAGTFLRQAVEWSQGGVSGVLGNFHTGAAIYSSLLALLFAATAPSELMALALNALFGTLVCWNAWRLTLELTGDQRSATVAAWLVGLFPTLLFFGALTLREVAVIYTFSLGLVHLARWVRYQRVGQFFAALASFLISSAFHSGMIFALVGAGVLLLARWLYALATLKGKMWQRASGAVIGLLAVGLVVAGTGFGLEKFARVESLSADFISSQEQVAARSRAAYLQNDGPRSLQGFVAQLPVRFVYFMFTPFPWMVRSPGDIFALVDAIAYVVAFMTVFRERRGVLGDSTTRAMLMMLLFTMAPFAASTSNYGTALRHRAKLAPLVAALYATARAKRVRREHDNAALAPPIPVPV
jgi:hypothetical protein